MRYRATLDNLIIEAPTRSAADCVRRLVQLLVPRYTNKVYLLVDPEVSLGTLTEDGLAVVQPGSEPSNFLESFRLIQRGTELTVVSSRSHRFGADEWRALAKELASNGDASNDATLG